MSKRDKIKIVKDSMGKMKVPPDALYGASTMRAVLNFPVSRLRFPCSMISAIGRVKWACAKSNKELGYLEQDSADAIMAASGEVMKGLHNGQFVTDIFQTGSGTSFNMNANEVIANLACRKSGKLKIHPNDHVNKGQSSNDVIPTSIHLAAIMETKKRLLPALKDLEKALGKKSGEFKNILKIGRTHLQDAVPMTLGNTFSAYSEIVNKEISKLERSLRSLYEIPLGGTAIGSGLNAPEGFAKRAIKFISISEGIQLRQSKNLFEGVSYRGGILEVSNALNNVALGISKISDDLRWLSSGPLCGIGELKLPELQPGSSIMPGKINPVIPEMFLMVSARVSGNNKTIELASIRSNLELNTMMPIMAYCLLESIEILSNAVEIFAKKCIQGIVANRVKCEEYAEKSPALITALVPIIGYDKAAGIAKKALKEGITLREAVIKSGLLTPEDANKFLDPRRMIKDCRRE